MGSLSKKYVTLPRNLLVVPLCCEPEEHADESTDKNSFTTILILQLWLT